MWIFIHLIFKASLLTCVPLIWVLLIHWTDDSENSRWPDNLCKTSYNPAQNRAQKNQVTSSEARYIRTSAHSNAYKSGLGERRRRAQSSLAKSVISLFKWAARSLSLSPFPLAAWGCSFFLLLPFDKAAFSSRCQEPASSGRCQKLSLSLSRANDCYRLRASWQM